MKKRSYLIIGLVIVALAAVAIIVYLTTARFDTSLVFQVRDKVSKNWVWDATIGFQDRSIRAFYQSDRGPRDFRFSHLEPGDGTLEISAPGYEPQSIPVTLKKGENRIDDPIDLIGLEIPTLTHFIIFEDLVGGDIEAEIRPVGEDGRAVLNHPCMELWMGARITIQMKDGLTVQEETEEGSLRGQELFRGQIEWEWDPTPETIFRYSARIPGAKIRNHEAPFRVIDYLIVIPKPLVISNDEIAAIVSEAWEETDPEALAGVLDAYADKFTYYIHSSWNVKGAE